MEALRVSETSVYSDTKRCYIPKSLNFMYMLVFCAITPYGLVGRYRRFGDMFFFPMALQPTLSLVLLCIDVS
jgi:hypothetical protein